MNSHLKEIAVNAALMAGDILKRGFRSNFTIKTKSTEFDFVTEYDDKVEKTVIEYIQSKHSDSAFLGEESGLSGSGNVVWIIDPLDGTVNFAKGIPAFSVSIAAAIKNETVVGVVFAPMTHELFVAEKNLGATLNDKTMKMSDTSEVAQGIYATGFPYNVKENPFSCIDKFSHMLHLGVPMRRIGSAALDLSYLACGIFDGFWEVSLKPWDYAAAKLFIEETGGAITNFNNEPLNIMQESPVVASNKVLHKRLLDELNNVKGSK